MSTDAWRDRLEQAIADSGKSLREISVEAGCGTSYLHGIVQHGKDPGLLRMARVSKVLGVSLSYIMEGYKIDSTTEELLSLLENNQGQAQAVIDLLKAQAASRD